MSAKQILAVGIGVALIILAAAGFKLLTLPSKIEEHAKEAADDTGHAVKAGVKRAIDKVSAVFVALGQTKVSNTSQSDSLEVKPIAELAFARARVRGVVDFSSSWLGSEKRMIAHHAFDVKVGWDFKDPIKVALAPDQTTVQVLVPPPRILSVVEAGASPTILYRAGGWINGFTPEDGIALMSRLKKEAVESADLQECEKVAREQFETFLQSMFRLQGLKVTVAYTDQTELKSAMPVGVAKPEVPKP